MNKRCLRIYKNYSLDNVKYCDTLSECWQYADYKKGYMICHYGTCIRLKVKM